MQFLISYKKNNERKIQMFLIKIYINLGVFDIPVIMHKSNQVQILIIVSALSTVIITSGVQYQEQQQHLAFGQAPPSEASVAENQTFRSAFDTFVSSDPGGYGMYEDRKSNVFKPGETFLLYVEPVGYTYGTVTDPDGNRLYTMNFTLDFFISDKNGTVLTGQQDIPISNLVSHHQNKELI
jgi:sRNA-binding regulator protein Hfq